MCLFITNVYRTGDYMNIPKLNKIADKVVDEIVQNFDIGRTDPEKVIDKLYKGLKLPRDDKELLDLIIRLRLDCSVSHTRVIVTDVIQTELKPIKKDIAIIKEVVGINGK